MNKHTFDQASWRTIKEFAGIYGVKMDYQVVSKLCASDIQDAMMWSGQIDILFIERTRRHRNYYRKPTDWKALLLKKAAMGLKNRVLYEELDVLIKKRNQNIEKMERMLTLLKV